MHGEKTQKKARIEKYYIETDIENEIKLKSDAGHTKYSCSEKIKSKNNRIKMKT